MNEIFYIITMKAKSGKKMYLSMATGKPTWEFDQGEACMWDDEETAKAYGEGWFKKFTDWQVEEAYINLDDIF